MQTRPMNTYRGTPAFTTFDPIANTPGTPDYVNRANTRIRGQRRQSVVGSTQSTFRAAALPRYNLAPGTRVPSLPRRNYIPTAPTTTP